MIHFRVNGIPVPKQSFRYGSGHGYTDPRVVEWENTVRTAAIEATAQPYTGWVSVKMIFTLPNKRIKDGDNLAKAILDATKNVCFGDDNDVLHQEITKRFDKLNPGVDVTVEQYKVTLEDL